MITSKNLSAPENSHKQGRQRGNQARAVALLDELQRLSIRKERMEDKHASNTK